MIDISFIIGPVQTRRQRVFFLDSSSSCIYFLREMSIDNVLASMMIDEFYIHPHCVFLHRNPSRGDTAKDLNVNAEQREP